jgi:NAD(P)-dependent dehydrogenase (short-subunit alcohol dehydrogenase family)
MSPGRQQTASDVALVTGAARGIGRAIAHRLLSAGAHVFLADQDGKTLGQTVEELKEATDTSAVHGIELDVTSSQQVNKAVSQIVDTAGGLDILVNNAGILRDGWIANISDDDWEQVIKVNLTGAFYASRAAVAVMSANDYGRIVNISSRSWMGNPGQSNYSASKAGIVGLTRALALETARRGITVNAVAPGMIDTPMTRSLKPEVRDRLIAAQPGGRMGTPAEVAAVVNFLASREASFVTGQVVSVCGGKSAGMGGVA